ncbi:MAG: 50S ribosomal protein L4 [Candidatus Delongbacteria bacterium]|nr:50S ribosomal protein L4 [Candidatus Delongbacteria bacterium]
MIVPVYSVEGRPVREIELADGIFQAAINQDLIYRSVTTYLANQRQGTAHARTRTETSGSTRKPWRQKHTGRARSGSVKSPVWIGGGKSFGPHPRDYEKKLPKKMRKLALFSALSLKLKEQQLMVVEDFNMNEPKTKKMASILKNLELNEKKCLFVISDQNENLIKSCRNIPTLDTINAKLINTYTVLKNERLLLTPSGVQILQEVFS